MCTSCSFLSFWHILGTHRSHNKKSTVGSRSENILHGSHSSDWIDIAQIFFVHHISSYKSVHTVWGLPAKEWSTFQFNMVVV